MKSVFVKGEKDISKNEVYIRKKIKWFLGDENLGSCSLNLSWPTLPKRLTFANFRHSCTTFMILAKPCSTKVNVQQKRNAIHSICIKCNFIELQAKPKYL